MSSDAFGLIELIGAFGLILGLLVWQLISVRRELRKDRERAADTPAGEDTTRA